MSAGVALAGASVLVVGATGGLGRMLTLECARRGAVLTIAGRDAAKLDALSQEVGVPVTSVIGDLRDPETAERFVTAARDAVGRVDVVLNAVGVVAFGDVTDLDVDTLEELFLVNTFGAVLLAKAALATLAEGGVIVQISGVIAERNMPGMAAYGASKAAVRSFDEACAREARRRRVRVLDVRPPHTETGLAGRAVAGTAPRMPEGLDPSVVARVVCDAIESGTDDLPSEAFA
jgi:cyclic-di-GMP-binding biofilm dispersal mediator protein